MRRFPFIAGLLALLALDGAALYDILKANEPNLYAEYTALGASLVIFAVVIITGLRKRKKRAT